MTRKQRAAAAVAAVALAAGVTRLALPPAAPSPRTLTLSWEYPPDSNIIFNVWHRTNLQTGRWQFLATTTNRDFKFSPDLPMDFFTVTASNTESGLESEMP